MYFYDNNLFAYIIYKCYYYKFKTRHDSSLQLRKKSTKQKLIIF